MMSPFKRKRVSLPIEKKLEIINRIENGESRTVLSRVYNIGKATIYDIMNKKDTLLKFVSELDECDIKKRKTMKNPNDTKLENAVYLWYMQKKSVGEPVTGPLLCEKALEINEKLGGSPDFKASSGWLHNFKLRHGIKGHESSVDGLAVESFKMEFQEFLNSNFYIKDNIYNVDEFSLNWNSLPHKQFTTYSHEIFTPKSSQKSSQERLTVMVCTNTCGSHKLPLLVVADPKHSECFKDLDNIPVIYASKKSCVMDPEIFTDWYTNTFIPNVKRINEGKPGRILLLLDNAQCHPYSEALNAIDENFSVFFIPLNIASFLQPVNQGVSDEIKQSYRKKIANFLLSNNDECISNDRKNVIMKDAIYMLEEAWNGVSDQTIKEAWYKLWQNVETLEDKIKLELTDESCINNDNDESTSSENQRFSSLHEDVSYDESETKNSLSNIITDNDLIYINPNSNNEENHNISKSHSVNNRISNPINSNLKRKHVSLPIETKLEIISRIENGESRAVLSRIYNIGKTTITDIMNKKEMFLKFISKLDDCEVKKRKSMKNASDTKLEDALHLWYLQKKSIGEPITGPLLCEKALELNVKFGGSPDFKASSGWLYNFKLRHGIRGHECSWDVSAVELFKMKFNEFINIGGYSKDNVYNVDEFSLNWRSLPRSQFSSLQDISSSDLMKLDKERLTVMLCSNASGTHKFPLFITSDLDIATELFKSTNDLPVMCNTQKSSIIDTETFTNWYADVFIKSIRQKHETDGNRGKVLLIFDNVRYQPLLENLKTTDENFSVLLIPLNVAPFLQPMNQGVVDELKDSYRKRIISLILSDQYKENIESFIKKFIIRNAVDILANTWNDIADETITFSWNKLWKTNMTSGSTAVNETSDDKDIDNIMKYFSNKIPGFPVSDDSSSTTSEFQNDTHEPKFKYENYMQSIASDTQNTDDEYNDNKQDIEDERNSKNIQSHSEAYLAINKVIEWYEQQPEFDSKQMLILHSIKNLASSKMISNL
ncbi:uncharacterized protein LOC142327552 [Lycorma delicatula]|uniref:uncharacterized protein LOC142327552 n=1 Tax=Lycorma delicatula TaxID=130591 RepID=UPI003F511814